VAESSFEYRLERMFADAPSLADAELFAAQVLERLDRGWMFRTLLIGAMGVLGGLIGVFEILHTGALGRLSALGARAAQALAQAQPTGLWELRMDLQPLIGILVLGSLAAAFGVRRLMREI
jgi:hypothetical protein